MPTQRLNPAHFILQHTTSDLFKTRCTATVTKKYYKSSVAIELPHVCKTRRYLDFCFLFNRVKARHVLSLKPPMEF